MALEWRPGKSKVKEGRLSVSAHPFTSCIKSHLWSQSGTEDSRVMGSPGQACSFQQCFDFECNFSL